MIFIVYCTIVLITLLYTTVLMGNRDIDDINWREYINCAFFFTVVFLSIYGMKEP